MAKELAKFESIPTAQCPKPGRPYQYREYPTMMYKPTRNERGVLRFDGQVAKDEQDVRRLESVGYVRGGQGEALAALERQELEIAKLAANRAHGDRTMGDVARREAAAVDDATDQHVPEIPRTPVPRRQKIDVGGSVPPAVPKARKRTPAASRGLST